MVDEKDIFECRECGYCCHGETTVSLDKSDRKRMTAFLDMDPADVKRKYWRQTGTVIQMKTVDGRCVFYNNGCTIHPGKPWRCSQWPLHPSILKDEANFKAIRESCPGINRQLNYEEFCRILVELLNQAPCDHLRNKGE